MSKPPKNWGHVPRLGNPGLRVVETGRTEQSINKAAKKGFRPLFVNVTPSREVYDTKFIFQNTSTGEIMVDCDVRGPRAEGVEHSHSITYYPYHYPSPFAAYLIPHDLLKDERVWLEDVIEDILAVRGNQGYYPRLASAEAIWDGNAFQIQFDKDDIPMWIG
jgi:hypothetical protein